MILDRVARSLVALCLGILGFVVSPFALGASPHQMSPLIAVGPSVQPAVQGPNFGLFRCQVGIDPFARVCYDPYQLRHAYGADAFINSGIDGTGRTIVIIDAFQAPTLASDVGAFISFYGLPAINLTVEAPCGQVPFTGTPDQVSWWSEITLDVESSHAMAPGANIILVLSKTDQDADIECALNYAVTNHIGDIISMSFGENESCVDPVAFPKYIQDFTAATLAGITLFASSADQGAALTTCDGTSWVKAVSFPASVPLVTAVGGTELHAAGYCLASLGCNPATAPQPGTYEFEIAWNEGPTFGDFQSLLSSTESTGGGESIIFSQPPWQKSTVGGNSRGVPDVAYTGAIFHGELIIWQGSTFLFGGTSVGSPGWSALTAIAGQLNGGSLGFLSKALYKAKPGSFNDITSGTNSSFQPFDAFGNPITPPVTVIGFDAGPGYDFTTGVGSPITENLFPLHVPPGDAVSAVNSTKAKPNTPPYPTGQVKPH
jgi:subtilase family serine protease